MNAKEKSRELYNKFYNTNSHDNSVTARQEIAKQCALIAVDEVLNSNQTWYEGTIPYGYWKEVRKEIEKI
jgi:hypothetical protein